VKLKGTLQRGLRPFEREINEINEREKILMK
jgi:hypothetical protein